MENGVPKTEKHQSFPGGSADVFLGVECCAESFGRRRQNKSEDALIYVFFAVPAKPDEFNINIVNGKIFSRGVL